MIMTFSPNGKPVTRAINESKPQRSGADCLIR
jgi:hypothetical protein